MMVTVVANLQSPVLVEDRILSDRRRRLLPLLSVWRNLKMLNLVMETFDRLSEQNKTKQKEKGQIIRSTM